MSDRNWNFLRDSIRAHYIHHQPKFYGNREQRISHHANNNLASRDSSDALSSAETSRKEGLYVKKENSNYQRFVDYPKDMALEEQERDLKKDHTDQQPEVHERNEELLNKDCLEKGLAPLVGWRNGSPTLFFNSLESVADNEVQIIEKNKIPPVLVPASKTPKNSGTGRDDDDRDNLSSIANDQGIPFTPKLTTGKSFESSSQDASLATTSNFDLDDEELDVQQLDSKSLSIDNKIGEVPMKSTEKYLISPYLTTNINLTDKPNQNADDQNKFSMNNDRIQERKDVTPENTQGIQVNEQYFGLKSSTLPNSGCRKENPLQSIDKDSIDASDVMLEIYDDNDFENSISDSKKKPLIPDGGWGWIVVFSSLVISMIADGVSFSFGLLYIEFLYEFEASKATTAWIGSLFMAVPLLSGPIMSALVDRYGCRKMTIAGGIISGTGFVLSSRANSIGVMYLTFGVLAGLGLGLCYVTAVVSIAFWFDKKRTLAVGLGACGTGIGTFVYAPMTTYFISNFGWRGCVLLLAGTFFNMIACGCVMKDPEWWVQEQKKQQGLLSPKKSQGNKSQDDGRSQCSPTDEDFPGIEELRRLMKTGQAPEYLLQNLRTTTETRSNSNGNPTFRSVVNLPTFVRQSEKVPLEVLESLSSNSRLYNVILENYPSLLFCRSASDKKLYDSSGDVNNKSGVTMSMRL